MAEDLQGIKRRIRSIKSTERITNAMKLVSASKLRYAKAQMEHSQYYLHRLISTAQDAFRDSSHVPPEFISGRREINTSCYVIITSCSGLCGSFNGDVIRRAEQEIQACKNDVKLLCIGTRGMEYFKRRGYEILDETLATSAFADRVEYSDVQEITGSLMKRFMSGEIDEIVFVTTAYVNPLVQRVEVNRALPLDIEKLKKAEDEQVKREGFRHPVDYEPSAEVLFRELVPRYLSITLYSEAIESVTCEHAARRQAMENANDNASDLLGSLQTAYNRARQTQITNEIIEIVGGAINE